MNFCTLENGRFSNCVYSTKYATISKPGDDKYDFFPMQFDIQGLPEDAKMRYLKEELEFSLVLSLLVRQERVMERYLNRFRE